MKFHLIIAAGCLLAVLNLPAAPALTDEQYQILQQELRQEQIKASTQRVGNQLDGLIREFQRNGIAGEEVKILSGIRSVLGRLSEKDMAKVVTLLQQAREKTTLSRDQVTSAYSGQKGIILQLRHLLSEFQNQQALHDLAARFEELAAKQTVNLKEAAALSSLKNAGRRTAASEERQTLSLQLQEIQETSIKDETGVLLGDVEKLTKQRDGDISDAAATVLQKAGSERLVPRLEEAVQHLKGGAISSAIESETKSRDLFRELARMLGTPMKPTEALRDAMAELDAIVEQQKALIDLTRKLGKGVRDPQPLQDRQSEIADKTGMLRQDLKGLAATAPQHLEKAAEKMQEAKAALAERQNPQPKRDAALQKENEALARLLEARKSLQEQVARADDVQKTPLDPMSNTTNLLAQVRDLKESQQKVRERTAKAAVELQSAKSEAPQQAKVKRDTDGVQDRASLMMPSVAKSLSSAAAAMEKAESAMKQGTDADQPQAAAIEALTQAENELIENVNKLAQARQDLEKLADLSEELGQVIEQEQGLQKETAKATAANEKNLNDLAAKQQAAREKTAQLQKQTAKAAPQSARSLADAAKKMGQAKQQLDQQSPAAAQESQQQALENLDEARSNLEEQMKDLAQALGLPQLESPQDLANAAQAIAEAQQQVSKAMEKLQPPPDALRQLQKEQQELATAVQDLAAQPQASSLPKSAPEEAQNAAAQLGKSNLPEAIKAMRQSEQSLHSAAAPKPDDSAKENSDASKLASQQTALKERAEKLAASDATPAVPPLESASQSVSPLTAGKAGPLPSAAQDALRSAQSALAQAAANAAANQGSPAQAQASSAQESLAQAAAALAMAREGMGGKQAKQGKQPGKPKGQQEGEGEEGKSSSNKASRQNAKAAAAEAPRRTAEGAGKFIGLPKRDRAAIQQSQAEKYPAEYGAAIEQYLRNLSEESNP